MRTPPNTRMQRTRSSASPPRSPLMRSPLGAAIAIVLATLAGAPAPGSPVRVAEPMATLRGLKGVAVVVSHRFSGDNLPAPGYSAFVVDRLKKAGIPIVPYESGVSEQGTLYFLLSDREDWVDVELRQLVALDRDPGIRTEAATWWHFGRPVRVEDREHEQLPVEVVDTFIHDYQSANPSPER